MIRGIALLGLNGSGKSTLAHALAKKTGFFEMDVEDYYFPEQRASRERALEGGAGETECLGFLPFSKPRTKAEVEAAILKDLEAHREFILAGVTINWGEAIISRIDIAFLLSAPLDERLRRIRAREERRFGARVLEGGDMFAQQNAFAEVVRGRDPNDVVESAKRLGCPVFELDGTLPAEENLERIIKILESAK